MDKSKIRPIDFPKNPEEVSAFNVCYSDIDVNKHANNSRYADWVLEHYFQQIGKIEKPAYIDMVFKGESLLGEELLVYADLSIKEEVVILIDNQTKGNQAFQMKLRF